jgi:large subunit ribosomal protein L13e
MVKHNNRIVKNHFRKDWERHVKTWFHQPARKIKRRLKRQRRAARLFPRPVELLRPLVHCPTLRYNSKIRLGKGFTLDELKLAKLPPIQARSIGIAIDYRRKNRSLETQRANVQRLQLYKSKVVVFPKRRIIKYKDRKTKEIVKKPKAIKLKLFTVGTQEDKEKVKQLSTQFPYIITKPHDQPRAITEKEKTTSAYLTIRKARAQANKFSEKQRKAKKEALGVPSTAKAGKDAEVGDEEEKGKKGKEAKEAKK